MTFTTPQSDAYVTWPVTGENAIVQNFRGEQAVRVLNDAQFDLLLRAVDAVVLSHAFSRPTMKYALQISATDADLMTSVLEALDLIGPGGYDERREVLSEVSHLPLLMTRLTGSRQRTSAVSHRAA
jgi:hypothetical protein